MNSLSDVDGILASAFSDSVLTDAIIKQGEDIWQIFHGSDLITIEVDILLQRACFAIESRVEIEDISREKLVLLSQYSFLWRINSGIYFSLTDHEQPVMMVYFSFRDVDAFNVRGAVFNLLEKFSIWKDILNQ